MQCLSVVSVKESNIQHNILIFSTLNIKLYSPSGITKIKKASKRTVLRLFLLPKKSLNSAKSRDQDQKLWRALIF